MRDPPREPCPRCQGTGRVPKLLTRPWLPWAVPGWEVCPACGGTGYNGDARSERSGSLAES